MHAVKQKESKLFGSKVRMLQLRYVIQLRFTLICICMDFTYKLEYICFCSQCDMDVMEVNEGDSQLSLIEFESQDLIYIFSSTSDSSLFHF